MDDEATVQTIRAFIVDELVDDDVAVAPDTRLFEEGLIDSMNLVQLLAFLEQAYSVKIPVSMVNLENLGSIESIAGLVEQVRA